MRPGDATCDLRRSETYHTLACAEAARAPSRSGHNAWRPSNDPEAFLTLLVSVDEELLGLSVALETTIGDLLLPPIDGQYAVLPGGQFISLPASRRLPQPPGWASAWHGDMLDSYERSATFQKAANTAASYRHALQPVRDRLGHRRSQSITRDDIEARRPGWSGTPMSSPASPAGPGCRGSGCTTPGTRACRCWRRRACPSRSCRRGAGHYDASFTLSNYVHAGATDLAQGRDALARIFKIENVT